MRGSLWSSYEIVVDALADLRRGGIYGIAREMSVPGGRLQLGVTEQLSDHREPFAERMRAQEKLWRRSWMRTSQKYARARMQRHGC